MPTSPLAPPPPQRPPPPPRLQIEHRSIDYVLESERHATLAGQGPFWFLGNFHFFTISIGFVGPGLGLTAGWTTIAGALGIMFGTLFMAFHGAQGPQMGLPQMIQSRAQFGYRGVVLALMGTLFVFAGFNVVNVSLIMDGLHSVFGLPPLRVAIVAVAAGACLAIFGHDLMHRAFRRALWLTLPLYTIVTGALILDVTGDTGVTDVTRLIGSTAPPLPGLGFSASAFAAQFAIAASYNIAYAPYVSDYSRYLPRHTPPRKLILAIFLGASLSGSWMIGLGAWLAQDLRATDALAALHQIGNALFPGCGSALVIISVAGFLPVIALNTYSAMLTLLTGIDSLHPIPPTRRARIITIVAISLTILACVASIQSGGVALLNTFLVLLLYFLVPWTSVNLVDYFLIRKGRYAITHFFTPNGIYGAWSVRGIAAYLIGFAAMAPFFNIVDASSQQPLFVGWAAQRLAGVDLAWLVGLAVSGIVYFLLARSLDLDAEARIIQNIKESDLVAPPSVEGAPS